MICLIVGYGSIGRRHAKIINKLNLFKKIYVLTRQELPIYLNKCLTIKEVDNECRWDMFMWANSV